MAEIAVMGHGVVGSGVMEVLISHKDSIAKRAKEEVHVKHILDLREFPGLPYSGIFTKDFNRIVNDPQVKIVVEVMGGLEPAYTYVKACLENGKKMCIRDRRSTARFSPPAPCRWCAHRRPWRPAGRRTRSGRSPQ